MIIFVFLLIRLLSSVWNHLLWCILKIQNKLRTAPNFKDQKSPFSRAKFKIPFFFFLLIRGNSLCQEWMWSSDIFFFFVRKYLLYFFMIIKALAILKDFQSTNKSGDIVLMRSQVDKGIQLYLILYYCSILPFWAYPFANYYQHLCSRKTCLYSYLMVAIYSAEPHLLWRRCE